MCNTFEQVKIPEKEGKENDYAPIVISVKFLFVISTHSQSEKS